MLIGHVLRGSCVNPRIKDAVAVAANGSCARARPPNAGISGFRQQSPACFVCRRQAIKARASAATPVLISAFVDPLEAAVAAAAIAATAETEATAPPTPAPPGDPSKRRGQKTVAAPPTASGAPKPEPVTSTSGSTVCWPRANDSLEITPGEPPRVGPSSSVSAPGPSPETSSSAHSNSGAADADAGVDQALGGRSVPLPDDEPPEWLQRTTLLLGREGVDKLRDSRVLVVGLGGVGSYVTEFLVRAGVGSLAIMDGDVVDLTNKNRQLPALDSTVGLPKAQVMSRRLLDINPRLNLVVRQEFLAPDGAAKQLLDEVAAALEEGLATGNDEGAAGGMGGLPDSAARNGGNSGRVRSASAIGSSSGSGGGAGGSPARLDWVVDCIDSIAPKLYLVVAAHERGASVVSSMGAGGRMDPLAVRIADISETYGDPFAANVRRGLRRQFGIRSGVTVVFSVEPCRRGSLALTEPTSRFKRSYYGTISFIPAIFGLQIAAHIINVISDGPMLASEAAQRRQLSLERQVATGGKGKSIAPGTPVRGVPAAAAKQATSEAPWVRGRSRS